ncbi:hypothetical protein HF295_01795 [Hujiaoplasma nucleasis]|uniref:Uncharacterized protein n=1 Tax=Hujiaoplasma nucleasis TaxID=2725268 RepID=A0A7L6N266_9MOLU|nr:hypothetical protein [Hujiaoplasma nucleasis]QLY39661.1 hypothetical protein HF295_01795 [Hujiaoplasma nucleasis]
MFLNVFASIDIVFYIIIGIAVFFGFLRGFKKSLFTFIVMAIFYIVFFITLDLMVDVLWKMELSFLGNVLSNLDSSLANFQSFENDYQAIIQVLFNDSFDFSQADMNALAIGLVQFAVKIIWAIAYFTVILILYKIITGIIRLIVVRKKGKKRHLLGAVVGALNGAMAVFVSLIVLGGGISFIESATLIMPDDEASNTETLSLVSRPNILELNRSIIQDQMNTLAESNSDPLIPSETREMMDELVENYNNNVIVKIANSIKVSSTYDESVEVPLHINLFDSVLSFEYKETNIALRHELSMFSKAYNVILNSDYADSNEITDIKGEDIRLAFSYLESSAILPTSLPIIIKYLAEENEITLSVSDEELYNYDYKAELGRLSNIIAGLFDILNEQAVSIDADGNEVTIDGAWVKGIFDDVSESRIILLATEAFLVPMIEEGEGGLSSMLDIPSNFSWENEYLALGNILAEFVDNDISIKSIESSDFNTLIESFAQIDITVLLDSELLTSALINILSQETDVEGVDFLTVPQNITWRSTELQTGELEYLLVAIKNIIIDNDGLDLENFDMDVLTSLSETTIDSILDSYIMRATITTEINALELGDSILVIPDETLDSQNYYSKTALNNLINAIELIYDDIDNFSLDTLFAMDSSEYDVLFESKIIRATVTSELENLDLGSFTLIIPDNTYENDDYLYKNEIVELMTSIQVISDDISTFSIETLYTLTDQELDDLLASKVIQATVSDIILANAVLTPSAGSIVFIVPSIFRENIQVNNLSAEQIESTELKAIIKSFNALGITDYDGGLDPSSLGSNLDYALILNSGSMHLTIDHMIQSNSEINSGIPDKAKADIYGFNDILIKDEITNFILASQAFTGEGSDVQTVDFDSLDIVSLSQMPEAQRTTILSSMIVRNILTPKVEDADDIDPTFALTAGDYEDGDINSFLTLAGFNRYIDHLNN